MEHYKLAKRLCYSRVQRLHPTLPVGTHTGATEKPALAVSGKTTAII
ncbi:hypothetical protein ACFLWU_04400 [Chloroflexota bacterium]